MLIFVKVIYHLSERTEKGNQQERFINRNRKMTTEVCIDSFILKYFQVKIKGKLKPTYSLGGFLIS